MSMGATEKRLRDTLRTLKRQVGPMAAVVEAARHFRARQDAATAKKLFDATDAAGRATQRKRPQSLNNKGGVKAIK